MNAAVRAFEHYLIKRTRGRLIPNKLTCFFTSSLPNKGPNSQITAWFVDPKLSPNVVQEAERPDPNPTPETASW